MDDSKDTAVRPDERVCFNCRHVVWMVAIGRGVECHAEENRDPAGNPFRVSSRRYTCEHFEPREESSP